MLALHARVLVAPAAGGRKDPLRGGLGSFLAKASSSHASPNPALRSCLVKGARRGELLLERIGQPAREHRARSWRPFGSRTVICHRAKSTSLTPAPRGR